MDTGRTATAVIVALAALGGLVIGAAVMLAALEARDDGETDAEQRLEELFTVASGDSQQFDFVLDELQARFPRTFPLPPDSDLRGGFETLSEFDGDTSVTGFAMFRSELDPLALRDYFDEAALNAGWERAPETGGITPFGSGSAFCLDPSDDHHASMIVRALNAADGGSDLALQYSVGGEVQFACGASVFGAGAAVPMPRVAAAFSAVRIPGTRLSASSSSGATRDVSTWSFSLTTDADLTAREAMALTIETMSEREDIAFGEPVVSDEGAIVSIAGDDPIVGHYDGVILFLASELEGHSLIAELRMSFVTTSTTP